MAMKRQCQSAILAPDIFVRSTHVVTTDKKTRCPKIKCTHKMPHAGICFGYSMHLTSKEKLDCHTGNCFVARQSSWPSKTPLHANTFSGLSACRPSKPGSHIPAAPALQPAEHGSSPYRGSKTVHKSRIPSYVRTQAFFRAPDALEPLRQPRTQRSLLCALQPCQAKPSG